jgi:ribosomal protein S5
VAGATVEALKQLRLPAEVAEMRGKDAADLR